MNLSGDVTAAHLAVQLQTKLVAASNGWPVHCDAGSANSTELDALRNAAIALDSVREHFDAETISSP